MPRELALIHWPEQNIVLDPNLDDFGVPTGVIQTLRSRPISKGTLACTACLKNTKRSTNPWVHLRQHGDRLIVAHHASQNRRDPCEAESPEHEALKDRIAECAERHGFQALLEQSTADRRGRADVEVIGPSGVRIGHEVQLSAITGTALSRRTNTALRDGRVPSWLTTDRSVHSDTRNLIDRVPWAMSNRLHEELIRKGRLVRVSAGLSRLQMTPCRYLPGWCPDTPGVLDCSRWHTRWDNVEVPIEDFVGFTAAGEYLPVCLPTQYRQVRRRWVTDDDRELYVHATGRELEPERPRSGGGGGSGQGKSQDSLLHQGEEHEPKKKSSVRPRAKVSEVVRGDIVVGTLSELPERARVQEALTGQTDTATVLANEAPHRVAKDQRVWAEAAVAVPCTHYMGAGLGRCESTPSRFYAQGRRCFEHAPNPFTPAA